MLDPGVEILHWPAAPTAGLHRVRHEGCADSHRPRYYFSRAIRLRAAGGLVTAPFLNRLRAIQCNPQHRREISNTLFISLSGYQGKGIAHKCIGKFQ